MGWLNVDGDIYDFEYSIYDDTILIAEWEELEEVTSKDVAAFDEAVIGGAILLSFDNSPIVEYLYIPDIYGTYPSASKFSLGGSFKRVSNPNKFTKHVNEAFFSLPTSISYAQNDVDNKILYLTMKLRDFRYREETDCEYFFEPIKYISFDIIQLPATFEIKHKKITSSDVDKETGAVDYFLTAGIEYLGAVRLDVIKWNIKVNDIEFSPATRIDYNKISMKSTLLNNILASTALIT